MLSDKDIGNFFVMMHSMFGHKFKSSYGSAVGSDGSLTMTAKIWQKTLNGIPHIKDVMGDLFHPDSPLMEGKDWCPDLREMVQMCKTLSKKKQSGIDHREDVKKYRALGYKSNGSLEHKPSKILRDFMDNVEKKKLNNTHRGKHENKNK